jgi:hypothetical protein
MTPASGEELESERLKAKLGAAPIERDLLHKQIALLEASRPLARWRRAGCNRHRQHPTPRLPAPSIQPNERGVHPAQPRRNAPFRNAPQHFGHGLGWTARTVLIAASPLIPSARRAVERRTVAPAFKSGRSRGERCRTGICDACLLPPDLLKYERQREAQPCRSRFPPLSVADNPSMAADGRRKLQLFPESPMKDL